MMTLVKDYAEQIRGVSYKPEDVCEELNDESITLLRANNITDSGLCFDDLVYVRRNKVKDVQKLQKGDVLICTSSGSKALVGKAAYVTKDLDMTFGAFCKVIRPHGVNADYFQYFFQSPAYRKRISELAAGANINNIRNEHIDELAFYPPDIPTQQRIADTLDKVSEGITLCRKMVDELDLMVKTKFVEMFGDYVINPKHWNLKCLEDIAEVGSSKRVFVEELQETGIPFYRGTEVGALAEGKNIEPELFITEEHYNKLCEATGKPQIGDLLMPSICPDGRIWVVNTDKPFYFKDGRVLWVHSIVSDYNPVFLLYALKDRIMSDYSSIASGTTFAELKIFALKKCRIFEVPLELQNQFVAFAAEIDKSKLTIQKILDKMEMEKLALMQEYFL